MQCRVIPNLEKVTSSSTEHLTEASTSERTPMPRLHQVIVSSSSLELTKSSKVFVICTVPKETLHFIPTLITLAPCQEVTPHLRVALSLL